MTGEDLIASPVLKVHRSFNGGFIDAGDVPFSCASPRKEGQQSCFCARTEKIGKQHMQIKIMNIDR
jgi:hypothetical protein